MLSLAMTIAQNYHCSPTVVLSSNIDDFITVLNYYTIKEEKELERKLQSYGVAPHRGDVFRALL